MSKFKGTAAITNRELVYNLYFYQATTAYLPLMTGTSVGTVTKLRLVVGPTVVRNTLPSQHSVNELPQSVPYLFIKLHGKRAAWAIRPNEQHWQHSCRNKHVKIMSIVWRNGYWQKRGVHACSACWDNYSWPDICYPSFTLIYFVYVYAQKRKHSKFIILWWKDENNSSKLVGII